MLPRHQIVLRLTHLLLALLLSLAIAMTTPADSFAPSRRTVLLGLGIASLAPATALARPDAATRLVTSAESQIGVTRIYDAAYVRIAFPGGDVPVERGVCTDVVVRAYRAAFGYDLQARLNTDMRANFAAYPKRWGLGAPDTNIDHRRVPNLQTFLTRQGAELPRPATSAGWRPGDIVTQLVPGGRPHIGIVSATLAPGTDRLEVVHNIGFGTQRNDILDLLQITGRYRLLDASM